MQDSERFLIAGVLALALSLVALVAGGLYVVGGLLLGGSGAFLLLRCAQSSPGYGSHPQPRR